MKSKDLEMAQPVLLTGRLAGEMFRFELNLIDLADHPYASIKTPTLLGKPSFGC